MKKTISILCAMLLTAMMFVSIDPTQPARADTPLLITFPSSVTVSQGTGGSGAIPDSVSAQDSIFYSLSEIDVGVGGSYDNQTLNPDGNGTYLGIPMETGCAFDSHWQCVDEGPPSPGDSDTTRVTGSEGGVGALYLDTYSTQNYAAVAGHTISKVTVNVTSKETSTEVVEVAICVYSGTTLDCGDFNTLTATYVEYTEVWLVNPDDSEPWQDADVDALEIGIWHKCLTCGVVSIITTHTTLVYASIMSTLAAEDDYTMSFTFDFQGIDLRANPQLEIHGYRSGDAEDIKIEVNRAGTWTQLDANAFSSTPLTQKYSLSTNDVLGGVASVRILDSDATDDIESTVHFDEILIITEGDPPNPHASVNVFTHSEYLMWENRLRVELTWKQSGGPEPANVISRFLLVRIDGVELRGGFIPMPPDKNYTYLEVPWNFLDGGHHNATIFGYVVVNWSAGSQTYRSEPENLVLDNWGRWVFLCIIFLIILVAVVAVIIHYSRGKYGDRPTEEEED